MNPTNLTFSRLRCPTTIGARYDGLKATVAPGDNKVQYFFALDLHQVTPLLPRLMGSIVQAMKFLGPEKCRLSVIEGRSDDGTYQILDAMRKEIEGLGSMFYLDRGDMSPKSAGVNRIEALSELRNMALAPVVNDHTTYSHNTVIVFINDVAICPEDILELLYQHKYQKATMTCAFDWIHDGEAFYDVWASRTMVGNIVFEITQTASWEYKANLFWDDPPSKEKFEKVQPFQVYSCWGGMVTLDAKPFIERKVTFRSSVDGECVMGEPTLLAKDMWKQGIGKVLAVPTVNVGYSNEDGVKIKARRGYVTDHINTSHSPEDPQTELVAWQSKPPPMVKCLPTFDAPSWVPPI